MGSILFRLERMTLKNSEKQEVSRRRPVVSVYGSSMVGPDQTTYQEALLLGRRLGQAGADVACGGYGGVMEAVARGATEAGAGAIGYTVRGWDMREPNGYLTTTRECADLYERLRNLIEGSDALIAVGGGIGTLAEVMLAWNHLYMKLIATRPLLVVGDDWAEAIRSLSSRLEIHDGHAAHLDVCPDVEAALALLDTKGIFS